MTMIDTRKLRCIVERETRPDQTVIERYWIEDAETVIPKLSTTKVRRSGRKPKAVAKAAPKKRSSGKKKP